MERSCLRFLIAGSMLWGMIVWLPAARGESYDLATDWSETANPNGPWSYNEGTNALPHVEWWQRNSGGWSSAQPGWARSEDDSNRLPFWFRSNGSETFPHDFIAGDIVVHTTDATNGVGSGPAEVVWTCPSTGIAVISGKVWPGRQIGRSNDWFLYRNEQWLTSGQLKDGDVYMRNHPFDLPDGSNGSSPLTLPVCAGDRIRLQLVRTSSYGDFVGVNLHIELDDPPALPLAVTSVVSRKTHGSAATYDINLAPANSPVIPNECRQGGPTRLVFTFNQLIKAADGTLDASEVSVSAGVIESVVADCFRLVVNLTGVPDGSCLTATISGIRDLQGNPLTGTSSFRIRSLFGDATGNGTTNILDLQAIKNQLNQQLDLSNFKTDVNCNGTINILDLQATKNNLNKPSICP